MPKITIIVVAYRSRETIGKCVSSLPSDAEIIVVDNSSGSEKIEAASLPHGVTLLSNSTNVGFGRACNQGIELAKGEYTLVLNPDAWATAPQDALQLAEFLDENAEAIAVGGRLVLPSGSVQLSCARELTLGAVFLEQTLLEKLVRGYWIDTSSGTKPVKVPQVTGACFMMKRVNGEFLRFDDRFFLYCEDTELMKRLAEHGEIYHLPTAVFHHELGASSNKNRWFAVACYNRGKELYFEIHKGKDASLICLFLNRSGALLRLLIWSISTILTLGMLRRFREAAATFARVLFAPVDSYKGLLNTRR
ncbi:MAG: glycosyltransferase family 2 protein [Fimbriimonadales bacterium]